MMMAGSKEVGFENLTFALTAILLILSIEIINMPCCQRARMAVPAGRRNKSCNDGF